MKIPFDIKYRPQIESGEYKLETECGHPVSIMDWEWIDRNEKKCLAVKVLMEEGFNIGYIFDYDGKRHSIFPSDSDSDLFIITPELEFTDWETFISGCLQKHGLLDCGAADRIAKECSAELLDLARKEIMDGWSRGLHDTQDISGKAYIDGHLLGFEQGKADALKCLPRWEKCSGYMINYGSGPCLIFNGNSKYLMIDGYQIKLDELFKLPGFKED